MSDPSERARRLRLLVLTKYGPLGASSRLRFFQYVPWLERAGFVVDVAPLISDTALARRYQRGDYGIALMFEAYRGRIATLLRGRRCYDAAWIEAEALPMVPLWLERGLLRSVPFVLDFDDAIFHNYDRHRLAMVRHIYGRRIDGLMAASAAVTAGNTYLAQRAKDAHARTVVPLPTVIDLDRYALGLAVEKASVPRIVWIGSPSTVRYLQMLAQPLRTLAAHQAFTLRVIGAPSNFELPGVQVEVMPWSESSEVQALRECDVGIMPLGQSPWELGKCGYKLIQYMACGLPVVASPVGANCQIVQEGVNGLFASSDDDWVTRLAELLCDPGQRARYGDAGRREVEQWYCVQQTAPLVDSVLRRAAGV